MNFSLPGPNLSVSTIIFYTHPRENCFLIKRHVASEATPELLEMFEAIRKAYTTCQEYHYSLFLFRASVPPEQIMFNQEVAINLLWLARKPVLHIVDTHTQYKTPYLSMTKMPKVFGNRLSSLGRQCTLDKLKLSDWKNNLPLIVPSSGMHGARDPPPVFWSGITQQHRRRGKMPRPPPPCLPKNSRRTSQARHGHRSQFEYQSLQRHVRNRLSYSLSVCLRHPTHSSYHQLQKTHTTTYNESTPIGP